MVIRAGKIEIVYPRTPGAEAWAAELEKELRTFRVPASVRRKTGLRRAVDTEEPWLIAICTPEARTDQEINSAIEGFIRAGRRDWFLTLLTEGDPADSFPDALIYETLSDGEIVEHEPLAANITAPSRQESRKRLKIEKLRILAPILGVSFDELRNRRQRRRMRILLAASGAVLLGAAAFLAYASNRVLVISGQNRELNEQYTLAEASRQEAVSQRNTAREQLADTIALQIRNNREDNELTLLLCLEFLPESGRDGDLPAILKGALERLCADGYTAVTTRSSYARTREIKEEKEPDLKADTEDGPARTVTLTLPGTDERFATDQFHLMSWSPEYRYAVYYGGGDPDLFTWVRNLDKPEESFFLRDENGAYAGLFDAVCLSDGTFIGYYFEMVEHQMLYTCYRYDPFGKRYLPFREDSPEPPADGEPLPEGWISRYADQIGVSNFQTLDGLKVIFGETKKRGGGDGVQGLRVFDRETLRTIGFLEGAKDGIRDLEGTGLFVIPMQETYMVCRKDPFEPLFETEPEYTYTGNAVMCEHACYADGTRVMLIKAAGDSGTKAVYDLNTGKLMYVIQEPGLEYEMELTGDQRLLGAVDKTPVLWDLKTGERLLSLSASDSDPEAYGPVDEASGLRTSAAVNCGTVFVYREEAVPVPEDLEGQIALARELLNGRELTDRERDEYHLNRR